MPSIIPKKIEDITEDWVIDLLESGCGPKEMVKGLHDLINREKVEVLEECRGLLRSISSIPAIDMILEQSISQLHSLNNHANTKEK